MASMHTDIEYITYRNKNATNADCEEVGKEGISSPHTAEPNGSLYGVIEIQPRDC